MYRFEFCVKFWIVLGFCTCFKEFSAEDCTCVRFRPDHLSSRIDIIERVPSNLSRVWPPRVVEILFEPSTFFRSPDTAPCCISHCSTPKQGTQKIFITHIIHAFYSQNISVWGIELVQVRDVMILKCYFTILIVNINSAA